MNEPLGGPRDPEQDPSTAPETTEPDEAGRGAPAAERDERFLFDWSRLPYVTPELPGAGGTVRASPEDFLVEELPAYLPLGSGSHLYLKVEKRGLTTRDLVVALMRAGVSETAIGVAGLKDKAAVTVQWLSVPRSAEAAAGALEELPGVRVLERSYHKNKLAIGHLSGNRFEVVVRDVDAGGVDRAGAVLAALANSGAPNWFGPQRFGRFGSNALDGLRALRGESVPGGHRLRRFFVSALQSQLFNHMLAQRIRLGLFQRVVEGDWARKHDTGGTFEVVDQELESARALRLEISATLPLHGRKVPLSRARAGELELATLAEFGLSWAQFGSRRGDRRSSRLLLTDASVAEAGPGALRLAFSLPKGSYATAVLREVLKVDVDQPGSGGGAHVPDTSE